MLFVCKYPENETLLVVLVVDPVPPKARILEVWVMSTKILVKIYNTPNTTVIDNWD
jgi:hypothetical protein